jgi:23S rRNA (adenine2503-C2)-methyltransferase
MSRKTLLDLNCEKLTAFLAERGEPKYRAKQIWQAIYRDLVPSYEAITPLPKGLRASLAEALPVEPLHPIESILSSDKRTHKTLFRLADGETIETVLMLYEHRRTVCVSTQVGCAIGCPFCATGKSGFTRDLTAGEIIAQALHFARELHKREERLTNIVYMGMGEPFLNYEATLKSIRILNDPNGFSLGARHFTVSTAGIIPGIERFTREDLQVNLAISLHAGDNALRDRLVPINRRYPLTPLIRACRDYIKATHRRVTFEVALIDGVNDSTENAQKVAKLLSGMLCHVNLIPLNPIPVSPLRPSSRERTDAFAGLLEEARIPVTVRLERGIKIQAGCGQLRNRHKGIERSGNTEPPLRKP